jgi:glycosyltransferase involved in cell wall biosynthesis
MTPVEQPLISVLIPAYNYARFVSEAVDSVLAQTYPNVEIVVCDNRSTDDTMAVLEARYGDEPRVRLFQNERNLGLVPNFNRALTHARGSFVAWLSADDWLLPRHLARLHALFTAAPQLDVVYSRNYLTDVYGNVYAVKGDPSLLPTDYVDLRDELPPMLTAFNQICLPGALFRRELFDELGPMDERTPIAADWELAVRIALAGKRFGYVAGPSVCVRGHGANASAGAWLRSGGALEDFLFVLERVLEHPGVARIRGYEGRIAGQLSWFEGMSAADGTPEGVERGRRVAAMRERVLALFEVYEPARVREHRVSVAIPMVARPVALLAALDALHAQTFANWEALVVDHGTIAVSELLQAHPAADRIRCIRLPQQRLAGQARNLALELGRGEYVTFLDEDNIVAPNHLETLVATIASSGADVAVASARLVVERPNGAVFAVEAVHDDIFREARDPAVLGAVANALPLNAILHHRRFYQRCGRFNEGAATLEDFDYLTRLQSTARFVFSGAVTLDVHARVGFEAQATAAHAGIYVSTLDALYAARDVPADVARLRAAHRAALVPLFARFDALAASVPGVVEIVRTLAGRAVIPSG